MAKQSAVSGSKLGKIEALLSFSQFFFAAAVLDRMIAKLYGHRNCGVSSEKS